MLGRWKGCKESEPFKIVPVIKDVSRIYLHFPEASPLYPAQSSIVGYDLEYALVRDYQTVLSLFHVRESIEGL